MEAVFYLLCAHMNVLTGIMGTGNNQLTNPFGIARDPSLGTLYIADQSNHRVMSYLAGASSGTVAAGDNGQGINNTQLNYPVGVYFDSSSNSLIIANTGANNIVRWVIGASSWTLVAGSIFGLSGNTTALLNYPVGVILDFMGNVYVADRNNHRIQFFLAGQSTGTKIAGQTKAVFYVLYAHMSVLTGIMGTGNNQLTNPFGIARDPSLGTLYIADQSNHRVMSFLAGASSGTVAAGDNGQGINNTQLNYPVGVYFDSSSNSLIIANTGANNIVRWMIGASSWTVVAGSIFGLSGNTTTLLNYPVGVILDFMGNVYVADRNNHRIQFFLAGQSTGTTIAGQTSISGNNPTLLNNPYSMVLDAQLNLYVADTYNHRVQKFMHC
ncbi:unnamed protein product [Rotaria sordida]|uniref:NHL repeat containing protein n=2 Tax=Rotaria sordida TaxID=392033 RepID=A0A814XI34_9BILA|nr:unnamed protein product [Rotaria sordida]